MGASELKPTEPEGSRLPSTSPRSRPSSRSSTSSPPPNFGLSNDNGGWCNPPQEHFDLAEPAFLQITQYRTDVVPSRRRTRGVHQGISPWLATHVQELRQNWQSNSYLNGQTLSSQVTTSDGRTVTSYDVAPAGGSFGQTYKGGQF
ncbi:hypothetical protein H6P81_020018 [Aristolochia fimbriata]|uniref:Expansin n=1 Tax=Aristolochia fimbriata TaxID=158543 RepID=A0AAV7DTE3_ARIFI|nr:hypothetical protein H6P81_020018 [Aristolochia fimbriata]